MRPPSSRVLNGTADYYAGVSTQDADGAPQFTYPPTPTRASLPVSAQPISVDEIVTTGTNGESRVTRERRWELLFGAPTNARSRDRFVHVDRAGVTHELFAHVEQDQAGRGAAYIVHCTEKL